LKTLLHTLKAAFLPIFLATLTCANAQTTPIMTYAGLTAALASGVATNFGGKTVIQYSTSQQTLQITQNTIIDGGTNNVILDASGATRLFVVHTNCVLTLANLQLRHGLGGNGGAILNSGQLIVSNCIFSENTATNANGTLGVAGTSTNAPDGTAGGTGGNIMGGAIYSYGPLYIYNSLFQTNSAIAGNGGNGGAGFGTTGQVFAGLGGNGGNGGNAYGGAIYSTGSNNVIYATEFLGDYCYGGDGGNGGAAGTAQFLNFSGASGQGGTGGGAFGGAVFVGGSLVASNCTFVSDDAVGGTTKAAASAFNGAGFNGAAGGNGLGGGLYVTTAAAKVDLENSVFYGNICGGGGGGSAAGTGTISGNGGAAIGGGGYIGAVATTIRNCTLATNLLFGGTNGAATGTNGFDGSVGEMAGWDVFRSAGTIKMANSIVAGKSGSVNGVTDAGYNLCSDASLTKLLPTTRVSINPQLDSGVSYQGPPLGPVGIGGQALLTMAVLAGPATNAIPGVPGITFPATDGRLLARGTPATIGAFETRTITVTNTPPPTIITEPQNQIAVIGNPAMLSVNALTNANDPNPLGYQWTLNGVNLTQGGNFDGVNGPTLEIKSVAAANLGAYQVIISPSVLDSVTNSAVAYLNVNIPTTIQAQPVSKLNAPDGSVVTFKVKVTGSPPFYYQWRSNGVPRIADDEFDDQPGDVFRCGQLHGGGHQFLSVDHQFGGEVDDCGGQGEADGGSHGAEGERADDGERDLWDDDGQRAGDERQLLDHQHSGGGDERHLHERDSFGDGDDDEVMGNYQRPGGGDEYCRGSGGGLFGERVGGGEPEVFLRGIVALQPVALRAGKRDRETAVRRGAASDQWSDAADWPGIHAGGEPESELFVDELDVGRIDGVFEHASFHDDAEPDDPGELHYQPVFECGGRV
jgi:hypothetical protein